MREMAQEWLACALTVSDTCGIAQADDVRTTREQVVSSLNFSKVRRFAAAGALTAGLAIGLGAGPASAGDQHSGGVAPNTETRDKGTEVGGVTVSRGGGLPVTGSDVAGLVAIGAAAVAAGSGALVVSKRRTRLSA